MTNCRHSRWLIRVLALGSFLSLVLTGAGAAEDITIVSRLSAKRTEPRTSTQYLTATRVRTADGSADTIFDLDASSMTFVDHRKKQFWKTTPEEVRAAFFDLEQNLDSNPILKRVFGKDLQVAVTRTGETRDIAGYRCNEYLATLGKAYEIELCAAPELQAPRQYHQARRVYFTTIGPMAGRIQRLLDEVEKIDGLPLRSTFRARMMGREFESSSEAIEVRLGPVAADAFELPAGYQETKSPYARD